MSDPPSRDTLSNQSVFDAFMKWATTYKLPQAGTIELQKALEDFRHSNPDLTLNDAIIFVKNATNPNDHPAIDISAVIDWNRITEEEAMRGQARESAEIVKAALQQGIIRPRDIGLYQTPPPIVSEAVKKNFVNRISALEDQLAKLKERPTTEAETVPPPGTPIERILREYVDKRLIEEQELGGYVFTAQDKALLYSIMNPTQTEVSNKRRLDDQIRAFEELQKVGRKLTPVERPGRKVEELRVLGQISPTQINVGTREFFTDTLKAKIINERHTALSLEEDKLLDLPLFQSVEKNAKYFSHPERREEQGYSETLRGLVRFYIDNGMLDIKDLRIIGLEDWYSRG